MGDAGVPAGACQDTSEVLADPHLKARDMIVDLEYPASGRLRTVGCPMKLSDSPARSPVRPCSASIPGPARRALRRQPEDLRRLKESGVV